MGRCLPFSRAPRPPLNRRQSHAIFERIPLAPGVCGNGFRAAVHFPAIRTEGGSDGEATHFRDLAGQRRQRNHGHRLTRPDIPPLIKDEDGAGHIWPPPPAPRGARKWIRRYDIIRIDYDWQVPTRRPGGLTSILAGSARNNTPPSEIPHALYPDTNRG